MTPRDVLWSPAPMSISPAFPLCSSVYVTDFQAPFCLQSTFPPPFHACSWLPTHPIQDFYSPLHLTPSSFICTPLPCPMCSHPSSDSMQLSMPLNSQHSLSCYMLHQCFLLSHQRPYSKIREHGIMPPLHVILQYPPTHLHGPTKQNTLGDSRTSHFRDMSTKNHPNRLFFLRTYGSDSVLNQGPIITSQLILCLLQGHFTLPDQCKESLV